MYASQKNIQILVALLKEHGVRRVVISPGSRNMALARSLESDLDFMCYSVVDERSAAYFAVGLSLEHGEPVALSCTSAQATRNYIPGMTEAYYRGVPLVTITADYKPSLVGVGTMQAIEQMSIPKDTAKVSVQLPVVRDADDEWHCARLVNEALLGLQHHGSGPVHIDLPVEEHWEGGVSTLPAVKKIERHTRWDHSLPRIAGHRVLIAVGEHAPFSHDQEQALAEFADAYGAVVYTNHLSNYHGAGAVEGSLVVLNIQAEDIERYRPDLLITIGDQIGDYDIDGFLRTAKAEHWRVHLDGRLLDTYKTLTHVFEMPEGEFFSHYTADAPGSPDPAYREVWAIANAKRTIPEDLPLSHAFVAGSLAPRIPAGSNIHFAILSAFRNWNFFSLDPSVRAYSNVAAYGIDGCLSTFIGHSVASERMSFLVIGDLSFFYDMNSIGIRHVRNNARVVLVNNNGGGEFRLYSNAADRYFGEAANTHIAAAGHHGSAKGWVESMGWGYIEVRTKQELAEQADHFLADSSKPVLMEVFTTMEADSDGVRLIREANPHATLRKRLARILPESVKQAVPAPMKRAAKHFLGH